MRPRVSQQYFTVFRPDFRKDISRDEQPQKLNTGGNKPDYSQ